VQPVRSAYQPPASSTFLSEQTSQQYFSLRTNQHQPSGTSQTNRLVISLPFKYSFRIKIFVAIDFFLQL
jgi:hypothetical protein